MSGSLHNIWLTSLVVLSKRQCHLLQGRMEQEASIDYEEGIARSIARDDKLVKAGTSIARLTKLASLV